MILFDLRCANGHQFEAWFRDSASFDALRAAGEVSCALCGDRTVEKALMAPAIRTGKNAAREPETVPPQAKAPSAPATAAGPPAPDRTTPEMTAMTSAGQLPVDQQSLAQAMRMLRKVQSQIEKTFDHVGRRFADEARKIHLGEAEKRNIYGEATKDEAEALREEGIEVGQIPWLPRHDS
jgi:hypothetical protein